MQVSKLLVSNLTITEDEYNFGGSFVLSDDTRSLSVDIVDIENTVKLGNIKMYFSLDEEIPAIRSFIINQIIEKGSISSRIKEGKSFTKNPGTECP
ncbi:MAG: hypothetical protein N3I35_13085 [Clostridia bacterium]|nr:hypothetical protein [Clostridia bacterium]